MYSVTVSDHETILRRPEPLAADTQGKPCIIVLSGARIGQIFSLGDRSCVIGRAEDADVILDDEGVSRHHAKLIRFANDTTALKDLGSRNGTLVNGEPIKQKALENGDRIQIGSVTIFKFSYQDTLEAEFQRHLYNSATRDGLTGLCNRRYFDETLEREFSFAERHGSTLSVLMMDVDYFKTVNDVHGHPQGDRVLREIGSLLQRIVRNEDAAFRVGGEEFAVIARHSDDAGAWTLAERLRKEVSSQLHRDPDKSEPLTISVGFDTYDSKRHTSCEALVASADERLLQAKQAGRDCVRPALD